MSETTDKIVDKIVGDATSRLKIPIVSTYLCVLIIHNWDILYFVFFSNVDATNKILYVKNHYNFWDYVCRVGGSLLYAIGILVLFTFIDYYLVKWLKNVSIRKKGLQQQIIDFSTLEDLKKVIESLRNSNKKLNRDIEEYKKAEESYIGEISNLNSEYTDSYEYTRFGKLIQELIKSSSIDLKDTFFYFNKLLVIFKDYEKEGLISYDLLSSLSKNVKEKSAYEEIIIVLQNKEYIKINEGDKRRKFTNEIELFENDLDYLYQYLNIN
jgi:hypothetical protein